MATSKLIHDIFFINKQPHRHFLLSQQLQSSNIRQRLINGNGYLCDRQFSVFNEFSKRFNGEVTSNKEFLQSVQELKGVKEDLKVRMKQTTQQLHKRVDDVWTEAEETAKKVSANVKDKISSAKDEVKESFDFGKQGSSSNGASQNHDANVKNETKSQSSAEHPQSETFFEKFRTTISSSSPKVSAALQKLKEAKVADLAQKSYDIVKEELSGKPKRKQRQYAASSSAAGETSNRTEVVVVATKQSPWSKKWEAVKEKMRGHPMFKRVTKMSEPVVTKGQELAEDLQERWETSDSPVVHKIQDLNDKVFGENDAALSFKEIRRRDLSFSLSDFVAEVQEVIKPVLNAYIKGDFALLAKYCSTEVVERCKAEHKVYEAQGVIFDNKILHVSEVDVRETKMMGTTPIIILAFQTQQVYCVRDRLGSITEGSKDTIHTVYYAWAMQQLEPEDIGEDAIYSMWRLREMQQLGVAALI